MKFYLYRD